MKFIFTTLLFLTVFSSYCQNLIFDDFSTYNLGKIDGQNGYSTSTPSTGNGTGACVGIGCIYSKIIDVTMSYPLLGNPTRALLCSDTTNLQTADGPGKSLGKTITSGTVYVSILVNCYQQNGSGTNKQIVRLMDNSTNTPCRLYVRNAATGSIQFGVSKSSGGTTWNTNSYSTNQDYLIVMKYEFKTGSTSNDMVSIFINPDLSLPEPASPTFFITGNSDATSITRVVFPWNSSTTVFNGYIGINSVAQSWATIIPQTTTTYSIDGRVITPMQKLIPSVKVKYKTSLLKDSIITSSTGQYLFNNASTADYVLNCGKLNEVSKANGVTSVDVLLTQRHILNTTKLNSPYKIIAADVTGDKQINSTDVLRMKRLILGTDTTFVSTARGNRLWEFVDSAYVFPDTTNPFPFKDSISFTNLTSNKINQTFIGVKLGDVNYDWNPAVTRGIAANSLQLIVNNEKKESVIHYNFTSSNFNNINALQTTLHFDNAKYEFIGVANGKLQLDYNASKANTTGNIALLWTDKNAEAKSYDKDEVLFTLMLKPKNNSQYTTNNLPISINNDISETEAWDNNDNQLSIVLERNTEKQLLKSDIVEIYPSPAHSSINIKLSDVGISNKLVITDYLGKIVTQQNLFTGLNIIGISKLVKGMYLLNITTEKHKTTHKIFVQ